MDSLPRSFIYLFTLFIVTSLDVFHVEPYKQIPSDERKRLDLKKILGLSL